MPQAPGGGSASQPTPPTRTTFPKRIPKTSLRIGDRRRGVEVRNEPEHDAGGRGAEPCEGRRAASVWRGERSEAWGGRLRSDARTKHPGTLWLSGGRSFLAPACGG